MGLVTALKAMGRAFFYGIADSLKFHNTMIFLVTSSVIRRNVLMCIVLNGLIFLGSYYFLHLAIRPLLETILAFDPIGIALTEKPEPTQILVIRFFFSLYQILWLYPIYFLSYILSAIWYQAIVDATYKIIDEPRRKFGNVQQMEFVSEKLYYFFLTLGLYLQMFALTFVPVVGVWLCFLHVCWLYSLYSFEYRWEKQGTRLVSRLMYFEKNWAYFFGFGFPLGIVTIQFPNLVQYGLYALTAPAYIMMAITARPIGPKLTKEPRTNATAEGFRLPIYMFPKLFANYASHCCCGADSSASSYRKSEPSDTPFLRNE
mmetsp:Transcript_2718/g.6282  ORF Transcript_2718/g.6282 Transcript_2718/m.6282 type:complete len:316 (+) Transcript_2718:65-1012(+)